MSNQGEEHTKTSPTGADNWRKRAQPGESALTTTNKWPVSGGADGAKAKTQPTFTIIIRRAVATEMIEPMLADDPNKTMSLSVGNEGEEDESLPHQWRIWMPEPGVSGDDTWNVKRFGLPAKSARTFWHNYERVLATMEMVEQGKSVMIFQGEVAPQWEAAENVGGGRWFFDVAYDLESKKLPAKSILYHLNYWTRSILSVLSGAMGSLAQDMIVGLVLTLKPNKYRVSFWTRGSSPAGSFTRSHVLQLGSSISDTLGLRNQLSFRPHPSTQ